MSSAIVGKSTQPYSDFELKSIPGMEFWYDMSDTSTFTTTGTYPGEIINSNITDKSPSGRNLTNTFTAGGVVRYDSTNKSFNVNRVGLNFTKTYTGASANETFFIVMSTNQVSSTTCLLGSNASGGRDYRLGSRSLTFARTGIGGVASTAALVPDVGTSVFTFYLKNLTCYMYLNGKFLASGTTTTYTSTTTSIFGGNTSAGQNLLGSVHESICFSSALNDADRSAVEYYLMNKWKIASPSSLSDPTSISSCRLWLDSSDASSITYNASNLVSQWNDKSTYNNHAVQATDSSKPTYTASGINFAATTTAKLVTPYTLSTNETFFLVVDLNSTTTNGYPLGSTTNTSGRLLRYSGVSQTVQIYNGSSLVYQSVAQLATTGAKCIIQLYVSGTTSLAILNRTHEPVQTTTYGSATSTTIGNRSATVSDANSFSGKIYEVIAYNSALSATDRSSVMNYLINKWSITSANPTIPAVHPFYNSRPFTRPFYPLDIQNCYFWIDAADGPTVTVTSGTVSGVLDKSGNGFNLTSGSGFTYNVTKFNSVYPSFYNTSDSSLIGKNTSFSLAQPCTIFAVGQYTGTTGKFPYIADSTVSTPRIAVYFWNDAATTFRTRLFAGAEIEGLGTPTTFINCYYANTTSSRIFVNGTSVASGTISTGSFSGITLGSSYNTAAAFLGHLCEVIIYNRVLTTGEQNEIESYLGQKWGLVNVLPGHNGRSGNYLTINPTTLASNCALWLDASDPLNNGTLPSNASSLTTWYDKSGNARNAVTSGSSPTFYTAGLNSNPSVLFNNNLLTASGWNLAPSRQFAWFIVVNITSTVNSYQRILISNTGGYSYGYFGTSANTNNLLGIAGTSTFTAPVSSGTANPGIGSYVFGTSEVGSNIGAVNANGGVLVLLGGNTGTIGNNGLQIGNEAGNASNPFTGYISEIICYSGDITQLQRQTIEAYLSQKWGLTSYLPTNSSARLYKSLTTVFDPRQLTNCLIWIDASDSTTVGLSGGTVNTVTDKSGNGNNLTGGVGFTYNVTKFNGSYPSFYNTTATSGYRVGTNTTVTTGQPYTMFFVGEYVSGSTGVPFWYDGVSVRSGVFFQTPTQLGFIAGGFFTYNVTLTKFIGCVIFNNVSPFTSVFLNGGTFSTTGNAGTNGLTGVVLGNEYTSTTYPYNGHICEFLIYNNKSMSTAERNIIEGYLAHKWGLVSVLPSTHPYKKIKP